MTFQCLILASDKMSLPLLRQMQKFRSRGGELGGTITWDNFQHVESMWDAVSCCILGEYNLLQKPLHVV